MSDVDATEAEGHGGQELAASDLAEGQIRTLQVLDGDQTWSVLVLRRAGVLRAYLNACPHQYLPLDFQGPGIVSADGSMLMCTMHGAMFSMDDGRCLEGPAMPCELTAVEVQEEDGVVRLGAVRW
jgi:nitrite reductase/ring-hydroxylating ferredoxin subunit